MKIMQSTKQNGLESKFKIFFEFLINISMTIGLVPVVGVALPFMSYGGSSLLSNMIICALLMNLMSVEEK